jgi:hypothetical protein
MLSDLLTSYAGHFGTWARAGGVQMDARLCALMHTNMLEAADQARRMEGRPIPPATRELPAGVTNLDDVRAIRQAATGGSAA